MGIQLMLDYFVRYGLIFLFVVVFLEHLNCPGVPATVVMPTIGACVAETKGSLFLVILISIAAAVFGSCVFYIIGYSFGSPILEWFNKKSVKTKKYTEKIFEYSNKYGNKTVFICRLIPVVRTLISLVSGVLRIEFGGFLLYSTLGISIWNTALISFGYFGLKTILH